MTDHNLACFCLAEALAPCLGSGWKAIPPPAGSDLASLRDKAGHEIRLALFQGRLLVSGIYPTHPSGQVLSHLAPPVITCSRARAPVALADEIRRRFLPDYLARFAECQERAAALDARDEICQEQTDQLAALAPAVLERHYSGALDFHLPDRNLYGVLEVTAPDQVAVKLSGLSLREARCLVTLLFTPAAADPPPGITYGPRPPKK